MLALTNNVCGFCHTVLMCVKPHWWDEPVTYCDPDARFVSLHDDVIVVRDQDGTVLGQTRYSRDRHEAVAEVRRQGLEVSPWNRYKDGWWAHVRQARWRGDTAWG